MKKLTSSIALLNVKMQVAIKYFSRMLQRVMLYTTKLLDDISSEKPKTF